MNKGIQLSRLRGPEQKHYRSVRVGVSPATCEAFTQTTKLTPVTPQIQDPESLPSSQASSAAPEDDDDDGNFYRNICNNA